VQKNLILGIILIASPTLFALAAYPDTISMSWNEGRGGFLFAVVFIVAELVGIKLGISKKRLLAIIPLAALVIVYLVALDNGLQEYIKQVGNSYDVPLIHSWIWLWDYLIMTAFVVATLFIYFGKRWIRIAPAGPIFLGGSATMNTTANKNPPRPSFQLMLMVSGYAASANRVGVAMRMIPRIRFFCTIFSF